MDVSIVQEYKILIISEIFEGSWVAPSVKHLLSAEVKILGFWDRAPQWASASLLSAEAASPSSQSWGRTGPRCPSSTERLLTFRGAYI